MFEATENDFLDYFLGLQYREAIKLIKRAKNIGVTFEELIDWNIKGAQ